MRDLMKEKLQRKQVDKHQLRLILNLHDMLSKQVDFKNAFVQAALDRPMYMNLPPGLKGLVQYQGKILKLGCSLDMGTGMQQSCFTNLYKKF